MASSVIGDLLVRLGLDTAAFQASMRQAQGRFASFGEGLKSVGQGMSLAVGAPLAGFGALTVKVAGDFEASMNRVQAATGASEAEFAALSAAAREMGSTTQFTAAQSADAIEVLAKNGLEASEILGGALKASMLLAASSGTDLASAGDIATDVMLQFGKKAEDLTGLVDGMNGVLIQSKFGIDDYRLALAQAGGVAGGLGVSFEDFNTVIAATSSLFASGSDAGTAYKTFLQRLVPASGPAAEKMAELNLQFFDAQGNMKSMSDIAQQLQNSLGGLSEEARNDALSTIFGTDALRTAIGLMQQGSAGLDELAAKIGQASAADQAAARLEGFNGEMLKMKSAIEGLQLALADSGFLDFMTRMVTGLTQIVSALAKTNPDILKMTTVIAGVAIVVGPMLVALGLAASAIAAIGVPVAATVAAIGVLTGAVVAFWPEIKNAAAAVWDFIVQWNEGILNLLPDQIADAFRAVPGEMLEIGRQIFEGLFQGLQEKWQSVKDGITGFASGMVDSVKETLGIHSPSRVFAEIGRFIMDGLGLGIRENAGQVQEAMDGVQQGLTGAGTGSLSDSFDLIGSSANAAFQSIITRAKTVKEALRGVAESVANSLANKFISSGTDMLFANLGIPGHANGTNNFAGGWTSIHERGEEMAYLPSGSQIIPAGLSKQMAKDKGNANRISVEAVPNPYFDVRVNEISGAGDARMARASAKAAPSLNADNQRRRIRGNA